MRLALAPGAAEHEAHGDAGDRGMDPAVVHQAPDDQGERNVDVPASDSCTKQHPEDHQAGEGPAECQEVDARGEEHRDDQDGEEVVDHGEREEEGPQCRRQRRTDHREDGEGERDVGGGGNGPACGGTSAECGGEGVDDGGDGHPAECGGDGQGRRPGVAQFSSDQFALELDTRDEEEDREQSVGSPVGHGEIEPQGLGTEVETADGRVGGAEGVRPDQCGDGRDQQDDAADRLGAQRLGDVVALGQGQPAEQGTAGGGRGTGAATRGTSGSGTAATAWQIHVPTRLPGAPVEFSL